MDPKSNFYNHDQLKQILKHFYPLVYEQYESKVQTSQFSLVTGEGTVCYEAVIDLTNMPERPYKYYATCWDGGLLEVGVYNTTWGFPTIAYRSRPIDLVVLKGIADEKEAPASNKTL